MSLALTILLANSFLNISQANENLQFSLGDELKIYSEKAYRKNQGKLFEAIGNVIIISGNDTLYGEKASFDIDSSLVSLEGNIRYISKDLTIYGSKMNYLGHGDSLKLDNARMITSDFTLIAEKIEKLNKNTYEALDAEFTTCKDCQESWAILGKKTKIVLGEYVYITHAIVKIKGIEVIQFPYVVLPIKNHRESGLLFPKFYNKNGEGFSFLQPIFWNISPSSDMTFTPMTLGDRGQGMDLQFRSAFTDKSWVEINSKTVNDKIYEPLKTTYDNSGRSYLRNIFDLETHIQKNHDETFHLKVLESKDLDVFRDLTDNNSFTPQGSDIGAEGFYALRKDVTYFSLESSIRKNLLVKDPTKVDKSYVQIMPELSFSLMPHSLSQNSNFAKNISVGLNSNINMFRQEKREESLFLRNATRLKAIPYVDWNFISDGPFKLKTNYSIEYEQYKFEDRNEKYFQKDAGIFTTEFSFEVDKIYGLAYTREVDHSSLSEEDFNSLRMKKKINEMPSELISPIPSFEEALIEDKIFITKNSYRHSQEYIFKHHYIAREKQLGNERFQEQIKSEIGWFDYSDMNIKNLSSLGSNTTRTEIPKINTFEFKWNNNLIKKSSKNFDYNVDEKYLRDNFTFTNIAYFNISQGVVLDEDNLGSDDKTLSGRLTRLLTETGYNQDTWAINLKDYYFHQTAKHILEFSGNKRFDLYNVLLKYDYNSFYDPHLKTLTTGLQVLPVDTLGLSFLKEQDLSLNKNISTIYQVDLMPLNDCWILALNYKDSAIEKKFQFSFLFNFGDETFKGYKSSFFNIGRIN